MDYPLWARSGVGVGLAAALAYMTTPVAIRAARQWALYDVPTGHKGHTAPTPYLGGVAVMGAFAIALLVGAGNLTRALPVVAGVAILCVVGTIDDRRTVSPALRVSIEFALGVMLSALGHGWHLRAGPGIDALISGIWVVAIVNAFNLFDNMDGAASAMALVVAGGASVLGWLSGDTWAVAANAALFGACLGFLPHNLTRPARIFLGDGGSMPLGFAVAALVLSAAGGSGPSPLVLVTGLLLVGVLALDTCLVIVSRHRRGVSILTGGQDHLTHRTRTRVGTARHVAVVLGSAQAAVSALVIYSTRAGSATLVYILLAFVVCAATVIAVLENAAVTEPGAEGDEAGIGISEARSRHLVRPVSLLLLGLGAGLSPFFAAYYDPAVWVPIGLLLAIATAAVTIARPPQLGRSATLVLVGLGGVALWSLLSTIWASSVEQATIAANRWLVYWVFALLVLVLMRTRRDATAMLVGAGIGIALVAISVLVRMLGADSGSLFVAGRLDSPLGYINGEGCLFVLGCWLALALAERRSPVSAGIGAALTVVTASLALLSQSRGAAIATFVTTVVVLLTIPGARRRVLALVVVGAGVAVAAGPVLRVYSHASASGGPGSAPQDAVLAILLSGAAAGAVWSGAVALERHFARRGRGSVTLQRSATVAVVLVLAAIPIAGLVGRSSIEAKLREQWHAFVHLADTGSKEPATGTSGRVQTRLLSGSGNRYDYWRVAWNVFVDHPIRGSGAGNYTEAYFRQRRTDEAIQNPHSLEFEMLSELGLVGLALLATMFVGFALGVRRLRAIARRSASARTIAVAATGVTVSWLVASSGDWMDLLPGLTAIAIGAIAVVCRAESFANAPVHRGGRLAPGSYRSYLAIAAGTFVLALTGASLLRQGLAQHYLQSARTQLARDPVRALTDAGRTLRLDRSNVDAYYIKAAALARFNRANDARAALLQATAREPANFVTWVLLGDLEVRLHNLAAAKSFYGRAHELNPRDVSLKSLATDPASALGGAGS